MRLRALIEHRNAVGDDANARHAKGAQENNGQGEDVVEVGGEERGGDLRGNGYILMEPRKTINKNWSWGKLLFFNRIQENNQQKNLES